MKIRPLRHNVLVKRVSPEKMTEGGILIPPTAEEEKNFGEVIAVGEGRLIPETGEIRPLDVKAGQTVIFGKYAGGEVEVDGQKLLMMTDDELFGVVED